MKFIKHFRILLLVSVTAFAQAEYKTTQGFVYKIGDTLRTGQPMYISRSTGHWQTIFTKNGNNLTNPNLINKSTTIKKIEDVNGITRFYFRIFSSDFYVCIEEAIAKGEIITNYSKSKVNPISEDKYDKLKKIKELYDSGALTKEEFESEKSKILNQTN